MGGKDSDDTDAWHSWMASRTLNYGPVRPGALHGAPPYANADGEGGKSSASRGAIGKGTVRWQERGPPGPSDGGPERWCGQVFRSTGNGGQGRWGNRGGRNREYYARLYRDNRGITGKGAAGNDTAGKSTAGKGTAGKGTAGKGTWPVMACEAAGPWPVVGTARESGLPPLAVHIWRDLGQPLVMGVFADAGELVRDPNGSVWI